MKTLRMMITAAAMGAIAVTSSQAMAVGYLQLGDIKGESVAADDHSAGDEHEIEYDVVAAASAVRSAPTNDRRVASADINNDGTADVLTGTGPGGGPHVRVIDGASRHGSTRPGTVQGPQEPAAGLLLPAVQKVREAAAR